MAHEIQKMAVFAGCTYPGTEVQLQGPINDVSRMQDILIQRFGFDPSNIEFLTDAPDSTARPTGANIRSALKRMIKRAQAGDVLFFHFSGHGTRIPTTDGTPEDEAIVPCDFNLILDEDLRDVVKSLPKGAGFTFLSDACISSGFIDKRKYQLASVPLIRCAPTREPPRCVSRLPLTRPRNPRRNYHPSRTTTVAAATTSTSTSTSTRPIHGSVAPPPHRPIHGSVAPLPPPPPPPPPPRRIPGTVAPLPPPPPPWPGVDIAPNSPRICQPKYVSHEYILKHMRSVTKQDTPRLGDLLGAHFGEDASPKFSKSQLEKLKQEEKLNQRIVVFFSGSEEISVDVAETTDTFGALSNAVRLVLMSNLDPISNRNVAISVSNMLENQGFALLSCLYCSYNNEDPAFLAQFA